MTAGGRVPELTLGWRLRLAIDTAGISVQDMADQLGYSRSTISRWLNDQDVPRAAVMAQWSLLTGVSPVWLRDGVEPPSPPDGGQPASDGLARLAERKRSRARGRRTTSQYRPAALVPSVAA